MCIRSPRWLAPALLGLGLAGCGGQDEGAVHFLISAKLKVGNLTLLQLRSGTTSFTYRISAHRDGVDRVIASGSNGNPKLFSDLVTDLVFVSSKQEGVWGNFDFAVEGTKTSGDRYTETWAGRSAVVQLTLGEVVDERVEIWTP